MRQRTETLLSGLWELYIRDGALTLPEVRELLETLGFAVESVKALGFAKHVFTHQVWQMRGYDCEVGGDIHPDGYRWVAKAEIGGLAVPKAIRFYVDQV